jgi:hypothetical protein
MSVLRDVPRHFAPGCLHEAAHLALAAALDEVGGGEYFVGISGAGCGALVHAYLDLPFVAAPFGRGPSVARGLRLARPTLLPLVYMGDGELLGEGLVDLFRAAQEEAPMLVILVDNRGPDRSALPPLGGHLEEVLAGATEVLQDAMVRALRQLQDGGGFHLVRVLGGCSALGGDLPW